MDCQKVRELADSYLSGQLLVETNHDVVRHLETCPACREEITGRRELRSRLKAAVERAPSLQPRAEFSSELRAKLRPAAPQVSRRDFIRTWGSLAAGLVLATIGGLFAWRRYDASSALAELALQAAGDHQNCAVSFNLAEHPIPMAEAGQQFGAPYSALATFDLPPLHGQVQLVDRHACVYDGRRFAHIVFKVDEDLVSLLVTSGSGPSAPTPTATDSGRSIVALPAGRYVGFVISGSEPRSLALARAFVEPLAQRLA